MRNAGWEFTQRGWHADSLLLGLRASYPAFDLKRIFPHSIYRASLLWVLPAMLCLAVSRAVCEDGPSVFTPPQAYPIVRYEAGWNKNPFTLKTARVVAAQVSFARDFAIAAYFGDTEDPTVVVVNTKTAERIQLKKTRAAANGMQLKSVALGSGRKDMTVEVTLGSETAELRFNDQYTKQMAAVESTKSPQGQPPPIIPPAAATDAPPVSTRRPLIAPSPNAAGGTSGAVPAKQ